MGNIKQTWLFLNSFHIQILAAELLFCLKLKRQKNFWPTIIAGTAFYCLLPYLLPESFFWSGFRVGNWFTFGFLIMLVLSLVLIWYCFEITGFKYLAFYGTAACVIQHLVHTVSKIFDMAFSLGDTMTSQFVQLFLAIIFYLAFYLIFVRRLEKGEDITVKNRYLTAFTLFSMFMVYCVSLWTTMTETETIGCNLFDCFCCILLLVLQFGMFEWGNIQKQNEIMKQVLHMEQEQHAISRETIELINLKCHDLKHQISALRYAGSQSEHDRSIKELEEAIMIYDAFAKTGNDSLDVILAEKGLYCEKFGIRFSYIVDGSRLDFISSTDICSLFGNALDNAIESVCRLADEEKRIISMNIFSRANCLVIHMENYFDCSLTFEDGLPVTTKADRAYHGYGLKSIRFITEKYGGTMSIQSADNIFSLNILFPLT